MFEKFQGLLFIWLWQNMWGTEKLWTLGTQDADGWSENSE